MATTVADAVGLVEDGDEVYFGGFGYSQPFAAAHELIRQGRSDLRVVRASGDILLDQLIGAGCVSESIISHCWNAIGPTPTHAFRRAVEDGDPNPVAIEEFGLGDLVLKFFAGARRLPFIPAAPAEGTGQFEHATVLDDKYTAVTVDGEAHYVVRPTNPDIGFIHAHRADEDGNAQLSGAQAEMKYGAMACERLVVLTEELVDNATIKETPESTIVPSFMTDAVVEVPGGSHPSGVLGRYGRDVEYLGYYGRVTGTPEGFESYLDRWVYGVEDRAEYLEVLAEEGVGEVMP